MSFWPTLDHWSVQIPLHTPHFRMPVLAGTGFGLGYAAAGQAGHGFSSGSFTSTSASRRSSATNCCR